MSAQPGYHDTKAAHLKRLRRVEGQIRGLQRMVEDDQYCIDILTQVAAATKALQAFSLELLDEHLEHCVVDAARRSPEEADEKVREASEAIARRGRSEAPGALRRPRQRGRGPDRPRERTPARPRGARRRSP